MSDNQQPNHDLLEEAIHAFQRMSVPERPLDAEVLAQCGSRQGDSSCPSCIPIPPKRRYFMHVVLSSAAAAVVLLGGLALLLRNNSPPAQIQVAATASSGKAEDVAVQPPPKSEKLPVVSLEDTVKESQVVVVATAKSSALAPPPTIPGDSRDVLIQFTVKRVLKGKLAAKVITVRMSVPPHPDQIVGKDWVVCLFPNYLAGKSQSAPLTSAKFEAKFKEILAKDKK